MRFKTDNTCIQCICQGANSKFLQNRGGGYAFYLVTGGVPAETQSSVVGCAYHCVYKAIGNLVCKMGGTGTVGFGLGQSDT